MRAERKDSNAQMETSTDYTPIERTLKTFKTISKSAVVCESYALRKRLRTAPWPFPRTCGDGPRQT